jgi:cytidylate kinase
VVFPEAEIKIFLDADPAVRAERRLLENAGKGEPMDRAAVSREMRQRDERDRTRAEAPLVQAPDAVYLDSTSMTIDEVVEAILRLVRERTANGEGIAT